MIARFIGATPASTQIRSLLGDLCRQIAETYDDIRPISTNYQDLIRDFPQRLALATAQHPIVLFVDALDQLSPTDNALALMWLPRPLPENVKLIVSVLDEPGKTAHCLQTARSIFPSKIFVPLTDLSPDHGEELLDKWLAEANRTLQPHQREEIFSKFTQIGLPLYLKLTFEEARCWKSYTNPDITVLTPGIPGLIHALLERLSLPQNHGEMFVSHVLGYLAAARNGLTEDELLDILSQDDEYFTYFLTHTHHDLPTHSDNERRLPVVLWSRLYYDVQPYLTKRNADQTVLLSFYHRQLAQVVTQRYLSKKPKYIKFHQALADYFQEQSLGPRKVAELPWQLTELGSWARLKTVLSNVPFLNAAWGLDGHEVMEYWSNLTRNLGCRVDEAYAAHWSEALLQGEDLLILGGLLLTQGYPEEADTVCEAQEKHCRKEKNTAVLAAVLQCRAEIAQIKGNGEKAWKYLEEAAEIYREQQAECSLADCLGSLGTLKADYMHDMSGALKLFAQQEEICRHLKDEMRLAGCLGNQSNVYVICGDLTKAMTLRKEAEHICKKLSILVELPKHQLARAVILFRQGQRREALQILEKVEEQCRHMNLQDTLAATLGQQANILANLNQSVEAVIKNRKAEKLYKQLQNQFGLTQCLYNQALLCMQMCEARRLGKYKECWLDWRSIGLRAGEAALKIMKEVGPPAFPLPAQQSCSRLVAALRREPRCRVAPSRVLILWDWSQLKAMSLHSLRRLEWQMLNPQRMLPLGVIWNRMVDRLTFGWASRRMFSGGGIESSYTADQWFYWAAHAILIRPGFARAYFRRSLNGTLNAGGFSSNLYQGFDEMGQEVSYDFIHGIIDTEIALRLRPSHADAKVLQGLLIYKVVEQDVSVDEEGGFLLGRQLLKEALKEPEVSSGLRKQGEKCLNVILHKRQDKDELEDIHGGAKHVNFQ